MADTAFQTIYLQEWIAALEERETWLRQTVQTEANINGNQAVFLVAGSGASTATTRGANGLIPARPDDLTQNTATLQEWHDLVRKTGFTIDLGQSDQRQVMQKTSMGVLNRKIDSDIISILDTATVNMGAAQHANVELVMKALTILGNNFVKVEDEDNMWGLVTNSFWAKMMQTSEFSSGDYVEQKTFSGRARRVWRWAGVNWIRHPNLTGVGTDSEKCYIYHKDSIGHAMDKARVRSVVGYDDEQDYHYCRTTGFFGSVMLLNNAVVQLLHDGSDYVSG